jgi:hypothetical protein
MIPFGSFFIFLLFDSFCIFSGVHSNKSCLVLQVGYLDFVDFNGNPGNIDFRLPRMSFIKNEDFLHLERVDRDINTSTEYGVLPVSYFSCTLFPFFVTIRIFYFLFVSLFSDNSYLF